MADVLKKVPVREQAPKVRATNFDEVCLGYNADEAMEEASRCINCKNAKCMQGCPVSINIPAFVHEVKEGNFEKAYQIISESSALPAICGRVCPQESQCEGKCIRGIKGEAISIGKLERFVADWARQNGIRPAAPAEKNGKKVAVIGSGPSGLTCAGDLAKLGYDVTIFEALHEAGGVLVYGIPEFRLPKLDVVAKEVENVKALGVKIETNVIIGRSITIDELMDEEGFEAVFIGSGAGLPMFMGIPGETAKGVFSANEYLTRNNLMKAFREDYDTPIVHGKKVAVVGGGNVAMDAARTALRLGAEVHIVYRRSEAELPARAEEVHHAKEEGIIRALKEISKTENEVAKKAIANNHMDVATHTLIVARVTAEAAEIIAKQDAELAVLRTQPVTGLDLSNTGRLIYTIGSELQRYTIIAGLQDKYLITPHPIRESEILTNLRLIERSQVAFIDDAQCTVFNA